MSVKEEHHQGALVFGLASRLDSTTTREVEETILGAIDRGERRLVLDFTELEFISSAGLRALLLVVSRLKPVEGRLALFGVNGNVRHVFDIAGLTAVLSIQSSREAALAQVR